MDPNPTPNSFLADRTPASSASARCVSRSPDRTDRWPDCTASPDGRLLWHVRLWEYDRAVPHIVGTPVLIAFARNHRLRTLEREIESLVESVRGDGRAPT